MKRPAKTYLRSARTHAVSLACGFQSLIAPQTKNRIEATFWFYIRWPCGGWRTFDVRALFPEDEQDALEQRITDHYFQTPGRGTDTLPLIAQLLAPFRLEQVKTVSPPADFFD